MDPLPIRLETLVATLAVLLTVVGLASRWAYGKWANPLLFLLPPHATMLAGYVIGSNQELMFGLTFDSFAMMVGGYTAFVIGAMLPLPFIPKARPAALTPRDIATAMLIAKLALVVQAIGIAGKYAILVREYGNPLANIISIRQDYTEDRLSYGAFNSAAFIAAYVAVLNLGALLGAGKKVGRFVVLTLLLQIMNDVTIGGAYWFFLDVVMLFCAWLVVRERRLPSLKFVRNSVVSAALTIGVFLALITFRTEGNIGSKDYTYSTVLTWYTGGNIGAFGYFFDHPYPSVPLGRNTFGGLYGIANDFASTGGLSFLPPLDAEDYIAEIGMRFNTTVNFAHYYADFGVVGVIVLSCVLGLVSAVALVACRKRFTLDRAQLFALMLFMCFVSIRSVPTEGKHFWLLILIIPGARLLTNIRIKRRDGLLKEPSDAMGLLEHQS